MRKPIIRGSKRASALCAILVLSLFAPARGEDDSEKVLRVCQDPNNLPFSSRKENGFENKIAELFARDLGWKLEYTWFPQRLGFIRNTLRAFERDAGRYKCDLVIGLPIGFELAAMTKPYYTSTYALVYARGRKIDGIARPEDLLQLDPEKLRSLKIGVVAQTPPVDWLIKHKLIDLAVSYLRQSGDPEQYPGQILEKDLTAGEIDVALIWGPIAGYFARQAKGAELVVVPFHPQPDIKFDYSIGMGVRFGERAWKQRVEELIDRNLPQIRKILGQYGVPLLDENGQLIRSANDNAPTNSTRARSRGS